MMGTSRDDALGIVAGTLGLAIRHLAVLAAIAAVVTVPVEVLQAFLLRDIVTSVSWFGGVTVRTGSEQQLTSTSSVFFAAYILAVGPYVAASLLHAGAELERGGHTTIDESSTVGVRLVPRLAGVLGITFLGVFVGAFLLVVPGIYVGVRLSVAPAAAVIEDLRVRDALRRSWELTRGRFWRCVAALVLAAVVGALVAVAVAVLFEVAATSAGSRAWVFRGVGAGLSTACSAPFSVLVILLLHRHLVARDAPHHPADR